MNKLAWYWHRLRAMSPAEMALHARKKLRQRSDARHLPDWSGVNLEATDAFPKLPRPEDAPQVLRDALRRDVDEILAGRWNAFGHLTLQVDDPPKWHCDYFVGKDFATTESAFKLNHRALSGGADIKLIWELSRWYQLVRLAMAAYVLGDSRAAKKCVEWLEDWVKHNPPYRGWNWTSALEVGMRLIQFTWIDALLGAPHSDAARTDRTNAPDWSPALQSRLAALRRAILPPHVWFAWRHQSFGTSANNHLLGELVGCIVATVRWPGLAKCGAPLDEMQRLWEREVVAQFAEDGGNREQALNYQLFSWELCWHARTALAGAGLQIAPAVDERLGLAAQFFVDVQVPEEPWDYGDSDSAFVTPLFADAPGAAAEWYRWFKEPGESASIHYWTGALGTSARPGRGESRASRMPGLIQHETSGQSIWRRGGWTVRIDTSPLGHLKTAAHGHLDALHLSVWRAGNAMIIDPGTGCYYADAKLRAWLASRSAHNAPNPVGPEWPRRLGPFLWERHHAPAALRVEFEEATAGLCLPSRILERDFTPLDAADGFRITDRCLWNNKGAVGEEGFPFSVRWQFAPGSIVERLSERYIRITRLDAKLEIEVGSDWGELWCVTDRSQAAKADPGHPFAGVVSSAFRKIEWAPYLKLIARPAHAGQVFTTTFRA